MRKHGYHLADKLKSVFGSIRVRNGSIKEKSGSIPIQNQSSERKKN